MATEPTRPGAAPPGESLDLAGLVDYADGAVVSRTLLSNKAGTLTLFAFDDAQTLSEHTVPFDAFVQVLDGLGEFTVAGQPHEVRVGQCILMPADVPHAVRAVGRCKFLLTMLRG